MMMLVDYGGSFLPIISHSPWIGLHLADFVMPWFLFIAGVSVALVYKVSEWIQPRIFFPLVDFFVQRATDLFYVLKQNSS